jgi:hypothetical protein
VTYALHVPDASAAGLVASIARLIAELAEVQVISDRRADRIAELERENGRVIAELDAERRAHGPGASRQAAETPAPTPEPPSPFPWPMPPHPNVRALAPWLLLVAILIAAAMAGWLR